jgi:hypothetical protein
MTLDRRGLLAGIFAAGFAPAFVGAKVLMPVRQIAVPWWQHEIFSCQPVSYSFTTAELRAMMDNVKLMPKRSV